MHEDAEKWHERIRKTISIGSGCSAASHMPTIRSPTTAAGPKSRAPQEPACASPRIEDSPVAGNERRCAQVMLVGRSGLMTGCIPR